MPCVRAPPSVSSIAWPALTRRVQEHLVQLAEEAPQRRQLGELERDDRAVLELRPYDLGGHREGAIDIGEVPVGPSRMPRGRPAGGPASLRTSSQLGIC